MCNLKITSPLCILPTGAGLLKSLSPKRERGEREEREREREERRDRERASVREDQTKRGEQRDREGLRWKMEHEWEASGRSKSKKGKVLERCGADVSSREWEWLHEPPETAEWVRLLCQLLPLTTPVNLPPSIHCRYTPTWPKAFVSLGAALKSN